MEKERRRRTNAGIDFFRLLCDSNMDGVNGVSDGLQVDGHCNGRVNDARARTHTYVGGGVGRGWGGMRPAGGSMHGGPSFCWTNLP